jgi:hypothetical protein
MPDKQLPDKPEFEESISYGSPPASQINLNINLTQLPKCSKHDCDGVLLPFQWTTHPKSGYPTVICAAWCCSSCGYNVMYSNGKLCTQPVLKETQDSNVSM